MELIRFSLSHLKSSALACATVLGIPGAIRRRGGAATIADLATDIGLPTIKLPYFHRLMRLLAVSGVFAATSSPVVGEMTTETVVYYTLTPLSQLLVHGNDDSSTSTDMSGLMYLFTRPSTSVAVFHNLAAWFRDPSETTPFETQLGMSPWAWTQQDASFNNAMNHACVSDSNFVMQVLLEEAAANNMFHGLRSLVDVGGGHGAAARAITRAFPHIKCTVLDLEQAISDAPDQNGTVEYVVGDMFQYILPSDAALLKNILHCWDDDSSVKILRQCKRAIRCGRKSVHY